MSEATTKDILNRLQGIVISRNEADKIIEMVETRVRDGYADTT